MNKSFFRNRHPQAVIMLTKSDDSQTYLTENFEGPLPFLLHLIQKCEIEISDVVLHEITHQFLEYLEGLVTPDVDRGGEFLDIAASLLWLKSKWLLPRHEPEEEEESFEDPFLSVIPELIDYCRFKQLTHHLREQEEQQSTSFARARQPIPEADLSTLPTSSVSIDHLAELFYKILERAEKHHGVIEAEEWKVADKIAALRLVVRRREMVALSTLFPKSSPQVEKIVTFLALLELMKIGELKVRLGEGTEDLFLVPV